MAQRRYNPFGPGGQLGGNTPVGGRGIGGHHGYVPTPELRGVGRGAGPMSPRTPFSPSFLSSSRGSTDSPSALSDASSGSGSIYNTIQQLADEQEHVQRKTFTNWINTHLSQRDPPMRINDLFTDIKDGVMLLSLLEVLSGDKLKKEKGSRMKRLHFIANVTTALQFLESKKIKLVNINPSDVVDGKPSICLGLIWTIILYFQIEENTRVLTQLNASSVSTSSTDDATPSKKPRSTALEKFKMGAKKAMLIWAQKAVTKRFGVEVKDFGRSWRDGLAFNAIVHSIRPELVDMAELPKHSNRVNLERAFSQAENHLGIPRLLDPEDVDVDKPDEKSIMTYVAQFIKKYPDPGQEREAKMFMRVIGYHNPSQTVSPKRGGVTVLAHHSPALGSPALQPPAAFPPRMHSPLPEVARLSVPEQFTPHHRTPSPHRQAYEDFYRKYGGPAESDIESQYPTKKKKVPTATLR